MRNNKSAMIDKNGEQESDCTLTFINKMHLQLNDLRKIFEKCGNVTRVQECKERVFIQFEAPEKALAAKNLFGKKYQITFAREKQDKRQDGYDGDMKIYKKKNFRMNTDDKENDDSISEDKFESPPKTLFVLPSKNPGKRIQKKLKQSNHERKQFKGLSEATFLKEASPVLLSSVSPVKISSEAKGEDRSNFIVQIGGNDIEEQKSENEKEFTCDSNSKLIGSFKLGLLDTTASNEKIKNEFHDIPALIDSKQIPKMYSLLLGNLPKKYNLDDVYNLVEETNPCGLTEIDCTDKNKIRFCEIYVNSETSISYLSNKLDGFVICGKKLIALELSKVLGRPKWNF